MTVIINRFWIAANIIFELGTGKTTDILTLVNHAEDATIFGSAEEAERFRNFVQARAPRISWVIEAIEAPTPQRPRGWLIRGEQTSPGR